MSASLDEIKRKLVGRKPPIEYLSTGSTMLNLGITNRLDGGIAKGTYAYFVGDPASGKTWMSLTCLSEAVKNPSFRDYRFIYDNGENGAHMDIEKFFGSQVYKRLEAPAYDSDGEVFSTTVEEMFFHLDDAFQIGKPFIYIQDSMDVLSSEEEESKFIEKKEAARGGKAATGSFGAGKAKENSRGIRRVIHKLKKTGSILIVISQTRQNLGFGFQKKVRSGGDALVFYASLIIWSSIAGKMKKTVKSKGGKSEEVQVGIYADLEIKKNRFKGRMPTVTVPIHFDLGFDDLASGIDYLLEEKYWTKTGPHIHAGDFAFKGSQENLIQLIEKDNKEEELWQLVASVWLDIESQCQLKRRKRYD